MSEAPDPARGHAVRRLRELCDAPRTDQYIARGAADHLQRIEDSMQFLENTSHPVVFIGEIGIGKSSMIAQLSGLMIREVSSRKEMLKSSVLAVGSGGTTVCEVEIRPQADSDPKAWGIVIDPMSVEEMKQEIRLFAEDAHARVTGAGFTRDSEGPSLAREVQRAIRRMTGLETQRRAASSQSGAVVQVLDPIDDLPSAHEGSAALERDLLARANLLNRDTLEWWWEDGEGVLEQLRERFNSLNHGQCPTARLPKRMTVITPESVPGLDEELCVSLVDTRGFDGGLAGRGDIQGLLRDERAVILVCTRFNSAPSEDIRELLRDVERDPELRPSMERTTLVLMDCDDASGVNGADGDRLLGQALKLQECARSLEASGIPGIEDLGTTRAFDTLQDPRETAVNLVRARLRELRDKVVQRLTAQLEAGENFLENLEDERMSVLRQDFDECLADLISANLPTGSPLRDPIRGWVDYIGDLRYAAQLYASCRRNGRYQAADAYVAVRSGAKVAASAWMKALHDAVGAHFRTWIQSPKFADVAEHVLLRQEQCQAWYLHLVGRYADHVRKDVEPRLSSARSVWSSCSSEWGQGAGFKRRVTGHQVKWSSSQSDLSAHDELPPSQLMPPQLRRPA